MRRISKKYVQQYDKHYVLKVKRLSTTCAISGCSIPSLRNCSYLFSAQRSASYQWIHSWKSDAARNPSKLHIFGHLPIFLYPLPNVLIISWRRWGWILCSKTWALSWTWTLCPHSTTYTPSISTSMTTTGFLYTRSIWISWANFLNLEQEHDCTKTSNVLFQMKIQVQIWNQLQHQIMTLFRNPLLDKILKTCGKQIKTLIYNVFADYRSIVDCHNIIAK